MLQTQLESNRDRSSHINHKGNVEDQDPAFSSKDFNDLPKAVRSGSSRRRRPNSHRGKGNCQDADRDEGSDSQRPGDAVGIDESSRDVRKCDASVCNA